MANKSPYRYYLDVLSNWSTTIALESQWFVSFNFGSVASTTGLLKSNISDTLRNLEAGSSDTYWDIKPSILNDLLAPKNQDTPSSLIGCVFVREVKLVGERIKAGNEGLDYGGYQAPATTSGRQAYEKLRITFLETNSSFIDFVLRPWSILVGYYGLVARPDNSSKIVKCPYIDIINIAKTGPKTPSIKRKITRFHNVAPISVTGLTNTYASEAIQTSSVEFVYDYYSVLSAETSDSINTSSATTAAANTQNVFVNSTAPNGLKPYTPVFSENQTLSQQVQNLPQTPGTIISPTINSFPSTPFQLNPTTK
jgi:hypothetical protein